MLTMSSYFDSLANHDAAESPGRDQTLSEQSVAPSPSEAKEVISEQGSKALGGSLAEAKSHAQANLAKGGDAKMQQIEADMKNMKSAKSLFYGLHPQSSHLSSDHTSGAAMKDIAADMKSMLRCIYTCSPNNNKRRPHCPSNP